MGHTNTIQDFWSRVTIVNDLNSCWPWDNPNDEGYGTWTYAGETMPAYRFAYLICVGPIPAGHELDHLCHGRDLLCLGGRQCRHRKCVRPDHLEPVTKQENTARGKARILACPQGHFYSPSNTKIRKGKRVCRACTRNRAAEYEKRTNRNEKRAAYFAEYEERRRAKLKQSDN